MDSILTIDEHATLRVEARGPRHASSRALGCADAAESSGDAVPALDDML